MNTYKIKSWHDVNVDSYENGEGKHVHGYTLSSEIIAENVKDAIEKYFQELNYAFDFKHCFMDENGLHWDTLVDVDNSEVDFEGKEAKEWREGRKQLWNNHILLNIWQVNEIDLESELND